MRISLKELLKKLEVTQEMLPYETVPWTVYDADQGITCSAEVRMGPDKQELEAEIQIIHDEKPADGPRMKQIAAIIARPVGDQNWNVLSFTLEGQPFQSIYNWQEKCCHFFGACARFLDLDQIPDFEALKEQELTDENAGGSGQGSSRKAPKIRNVMGMKNKGF